MSQGVGEMGTTFQRSTMSGGKFVDADIIDRTHYVQFGTHSAEEYHANEDLATASLFPVNAQSKTRYEPGSALSKKVQKDVKGDITNVLVHKADIVQAYNGFPFPVGVVAVNGEAMRGDHRGFNTPQNLMAILEPGMNDAPIAVKQATSTQLHSQTKLGSQYTTVEALKKDIFSLPQFPEHRYVGVDTPIGKHLVNEHTFLRNSVKDVEGTKVYKITQDMADDAVRSIAVETIAPTRKEQMVDLSKLQFKLMRMNPDGSAKWMTNDPVEGQSHNEAHEAKHSVRFKLKLAHKFTQPIDYA